MVQLIFTGRYVAPFFTGFMIAVILGGASGLGITILLGWDDWRGTALIVTCAASVIALPIVLYRRSDVTRRRTILHVLTALWFGYLGILFGGMPGALIGHAVADDVGERIGWFATAPLAACIGIVLGWRRSRRLGDS